MIKPRVKTGAEYLNSSTKRGVDVLGGIAASAGLAPLAIPSAVLASIDNRSLDPFFAQKRIDGQGRVVSIRKFRSLRKELTDGPEVHHGPYDPRATAIGSLLRKYGLDEIPQLVNVLNGELSLVGLRVLSPQAMDEMAELAPSSFEEWHKAYQTAKPGIISPSRFITRQYREVTPAVIEEVMRMDVAYVKKASLLGDLRILGSTPLKLLKTQPNEAEAPAGAAHFALPSK